MSKTGRNLVFSYGIAAAGVLLAGLSHWWLVPMTGESPPVRLMLVMVVTVSAWLGGLGPGLFATALGLFAIVAANDAPGDLAVLLTRLWRFGSLGMLLTLVFAGLHAQRRRAEAKEREYFRSEGRYRRLVEAAREGIWAIDWDGHTVYANARMGEILGVAPDRLLGKPLSDFLVDPSDDPRNRPDMPDVQTSWHEIQLRDGDGILKEVIAIARPVGPGEAFAGHQVAGGKGTGEDGGLLLMVTDVSPLKHTERALREKESLLRTFYESSAMAMGVVELIEDGGRLVSANAPTARFFGLAPGSLERLTARQIGALPDRFAIWIERFRRCRTTGHPVRYECRNLWPTCPEWVAVTISSMEMPGARGDFCSFIIEDVTDLKRAEEALRVAKDVAEAASQAKDRFLAVLSHELRNPLNPVLIAINSMLESNADRSLIPAMEMIRRNIELEARLIDDLLDLSRIVRGRLRLDLETVDVHQVIPRAMEICRDEILVAGLNVATDLGARDHHVTGDYARIMQVTWNLIHNAVKYSPHDGRLVIRTSNRPRPSRSTNQADEGEPARVVMEFEDTGIGIDPEVLPRIFDAFEQGKDDVRGRSGGLGLGLAISRSLAEAMGGRLTATSRGRGLGATFRLEFDTVPTPAATGTRPIVASPPPAAPVASGGPGLRILLVEDNQDTLRYLATVLRRRGHEVVTADCLAAARDATRGRGTTFDLLLSDVELPDGSGLVLMRELAARGDLPAIAMSGFGSDEDLELSRDAGFLDHLTKPIDLNQLDAAIRRAMGHGRQTCDETEPFSSRMNANASGEFRIAQTTDHP